MAIMHQGVGGCNNVMDTQGQAPGCHGFGHQFTIVSHKDLQGKPSLRCHMFVLHLKHRSRISFASQGKCYHLSMWRNCFTTRTAACAIGGVNPMAPVSYTTRASAPAPVRFPQLSPHVPSYRPITPNPCALGQRLSTPPWSCRITVFRPLPELLLSRYLPSLLLGNGYCLYPCYCLVHLIVLVPLLFHGFSLYDCYCLALPEAQTIVSVISATDGT